MCSKRRILSAPECVLAVQGRSGSSKVDDFGTNRKHVYDFVLVGHCDYGPILYRFGDMVTYWLKLPIFATFLPPLSHSAPSLPMFPSEFRTEANRQETRIMGLFSSEDRMHDRRWGRFGMVPPCDRQTVGQNLSWLIQRSA